MHTPLTPENAKQPYETSDRHRNAQQHQHENAWQNNQAMNTIRRTLLNTVQNNHAYNNQNNNITSHNNNTQSSDMLLMFMQQMLQQQQQFMQTMEQRFKSMLTLLL